MVPGQRQSDRGKDREGKLGKQGEFFYFFLPFDA